MKTLAEKSLRPRAGVFGFAAGMMGALSFVIAAGASNADPVERKIDFSEEIRPIFNKNCKACHGGVKRASGLSFIIRESALSEAKSGKIPIRPGDPEHSELIYRVTSTDEDERMPPPEHGPALDDSQIDLLREWIRQGAEWEEHWAYVAPEPQPLPKVSDPAWCRQPLDRFNLARLEAEGLKPSKEADRLQWLRRVTFDLTGLPPTPIEARAFLDDKSPSAYEKVVDRLLDSPSFGERWTSLWLDLARYADTQGYEKDPGRTVWPYRDWLIRAFNADMPYDQFTIRQIAGDLLPDATLDDLVASVFNRNTQTNTEGGTDDEEYRIAAVIDRVNTTWEVWQGVTFRCVQCHSHPYDPIEHDDYYRFAAFFNTSRDWDLPEDAPLLSVPTDPSNFARARDLDERLSALQASEREDMGRIAEKTRDSWKPLKPAHAVSTKQTRLEIKSDEEIAEVLTEGTISNDSKFTIDIPLPASNQRLSALRIEALPKDPETALLTPEPGFVLSRIRAWIVPPGVKLPDPKVAIDENEEESDEGDQKDEEVPPEFQEIKFAHVFGDESRPFDDPEDSLKSNNAGWGAMPRIDRPRQAIFVPSEAVDLPAEGTLRLELSFNAATGDQTPLVINRGRFSLTEDEAWMRLVQDDDFTARRSEMALVREERGKISSVDVPVMSEQDSDLRRVSAVFVRGNWMDKGEKVSAGVPKIFPPLPEDRPKDRLALARWLVSPENPLTARVAVNHFWEQLFGTGLVETVEDFGSSGTPPSHPKLLDFLALRFQNELGWSVKKLLRELVLSAVYRQDAKIRPELLAKDPRNRLLARGPRQRLTAEMVRDQALAVSGLLSYKMYGPPVMPPQPEGIWRSVYNDAKWETSEGEDRYRRAVYTYWKRTASYPSFATFDAPSREVCTSRRVPTNTPLQALVTLNDPVYFECAQALAKRMANAGSDDVDKQIARGWKLAVGRPPSDADAQRLLQLYERTLEKFQKDSESSEEIAKKPKLSALAVVANALLNLDVVLTK